MPEPLSDDRLDAIRVVMTDREQLRTRIANGHVYAADLLAEVDRLSTELAVAAHSLKVAERSHLATLAGCCVMLGIPEDTAEPDVFEAIRRLRTEPARPSPDHSAVYIDQHNQSVWSDYPTMPPGDDVLPMVWASEKTQSREDLADRGVELRVVGWIK